LPANPIPAIKHETTVGVQVPACPTLTPGLSVTLLECADPDGQTDDLPTSSSAGGATRRAHRSPDGVSVRDSVNRRHTTKVVAQSACEELSGSLIVLRLIVEILNVGGK
jgi:hypothetical protein